METPPIMASTSSSMSSAASPATPPVSTSVPDGAAEVPSPPEPLLPELVHRSRRRSLLQQAAAAKQREQQQCKASASQARSRAASAGPLVGSAIARPQRELTKAVVPEWAARHHATHSMCFLKGVFFCSRCGAFSTTSRAGLLYSACRAAGLSREELSKWQRARPQLRRLEFGRRPQQLDAWPDGSTSEPQQVFRLIRSAGGWAAPGDNVP